MDCCQMLPKVASLLRSQLEGKGILVNLLLVLAPIELTENILIGKSLEPISASASCCVLLELPPSWECGDLEELPDGCKDDAWVGDHSDSVVPPRLPHHQ